MHCHHIEYAEPYCYDHCHHDGNTDESTVNNDSALQEHINNTDVHLSEADRAKLNAISTDTEDTNNYCTIEQLNVMIVELNKLVARIEQLESKLDSIAFVANPAIKNAPSEEKRLLGSLVNNEKTYPIYSSISTDITVNKEYKEYKCDCPEETE